MNKTEPYCWLLDPFFHHTYVENQRGCAAEADGASPEKVVAAAVALHVFLQSTVEAQVDTYYLVAWVEQDGDAGVAYDHKQPFPSAGCMNFEAVVVVLAENEMRQLAWSAEVEVAAVVEHLAVKKDVAL